MPLNLGLAEVGQDSHAIWFNHDPACRTLVSAVLDQVWLRTAENFDLSFKILLPWFSAAVFVHIHTSHFPALPWWCFQSAGCLCFGSLAKEQFNSWLCRGFPTASAGAVNYPGNRLLAEIGIDYSLVVGIG